MALKKAIVSKQGIILDYWKVTEFSIDRRSEQCRITITPYVSQKSRQDGFDGLPDEEVHVLVKNLDYSNTNFEERTKMDFNDYFSPDAMKGQDIFAAAYQYLKAEIPNFQDAKDI